MLILQTTGVVVYNNKAIAHYNEVDKNPPISIKAATIKPDDILTVDYFCDAPNSESKTGIYILDNKNHKIFLAKGTGTFSPLKIKLKIYWIPLNAITGNI